MGQTNKPNEELVRELAQLKGRVHALEGKTKDHRIFEFSGDTSETNFTLDQGWEPHLVFVDGGLYREGSTEDYTVSFDGFKHTVVMAVAPAAVDVTIIAKEV